MGALLSESDRSRGSRGSLHDLALAMGADDPGDGSHHEYLSRLGEDHGAQKAYHLASHGIRVHTPYLARQLSTRYHRQSTKGYAHGSR
jgi:hypothetical protein